MPASVFLSFLVSKLNMVPGGPCTNISFHRCLMFSLQQLFTPRRDNNQGSIIVLTNTDRVYQLRSIAKEYIFNDLDIIFIWIGVPKPHLRRFRLAVGVLLLFTTCLSAKLFVWQYLSVFNVSKYV